MARLTRGERFKDARVVHNQHKKQTMDEVSAATGVSKSLIQSLEDDSVNRSVGYDKVAKLAEHYGVTTDYLLCLTDDPHRQPAATDDLGLSAKAVKKIRNMQSCSSNEREYMDFFSRFLESDLFNHFIYSLYMRCQVNIAEIVYGSTYTQEFNPAPPNAQSNQNQRVLDIADSGKYNSVVSSYLRQMARFDQEQEKLCGDDDFSFDCTFDRGIVPQIIEMDTISAFDALKRDLCHITSRRIERQLREAAVDGND